MITKLSHASVYVLDQESARDFYVNKLGFDEKMKIPIGEDVFWLTVGPKGQSDLEITLMPINKGTMFSDEVSQQLSNLVQKGTFGFGVFECEDIYATYQEFKGKGVEFTKEPTEEFYGIEAMFKDDSGNWFSLVQAKKE
ncbi:MAG: VOC family protein [Flavobacteriales bacterium]|jgi:catechol 2,3-dioxygenase-like lactoylglutathione lyase family enzyme|nr:VOC family protein [Flavobacteriales bacterium]